MSQTKRSVRSLALLAVAGSASVASAGMSLVGDEVEFWGIPQLGGVPFFRGDAVVSDPGIEYEAVIGDTTIYTVDVGVSSILLQSEDAWFSPWFDSDFAPSSFEIRGLDLPGHPELIITGIDVTINGRILPDASAPDDYPIFDESRVSHTLHSVRIEYGGYQFDPTDSIRVDLTFGPRVPGVGTPIVALAGLAGFTRRRR